MSYQRKYRLTFKSLNNVTYTCHILEKDNPEQIDVINIVGDLSPVVLNFPSIESKYDAIRGSGLQLNLISSSNMQFFDLYTADKFKYKIELNYIYENSDILYWQGYLDTELYNESFDELTNYSVSFSATDGLALLDRLMYVDTENNPLTGITSQWEIIKYILKSLNLNWHFINVLISTTIDGIILAENETIFHKTFVNNSNFYDEDGVPMNMRDVLKSILEPYAAFITINADWIWITDLTAQSQIYGWTNPVVLVQGFDATTFEYILTREMQLNMGDVSEIGTYEIGKNLNIVNAINEQIVTYSPYRVINLIDYNTKDDFLNSGSTVVNGNSGFQWSETDYQNSKTWNKFNTGKFCSMKGIDAPEVKDDYLKIPALWQSINFDQYPILTSNTKSFSYKSKLPILVRNENYFLKIEMSSFFRMRFGLDDPSDQTSVIGFGVLDAILTCGNKKLTAQNGITEDYQNPSGRFWSWQNFDPDEIHQENNVLFTFFKNKYTETIEDDWIDLKLNFLNKDSVDYLIPLPPNSGNENMTFEIHQYRVYRLNYNENQNIDCRIKDIKFTICDKDGNEIENNDIETKGIFDQQVKESGSGVSLILGTNINSFPAERGSLMNFDGINYDYIKSWNRAGVSSNIEKLLLRTIQANYEKKSVELTLILNSVPNTYGFLTYNNYFENKRFIIMSNELNLIDDSSSITMQEINNENNTEIII